MSLRADLKEQKECGRYLGRSRFFLGKQDGGRRGGVGKSERKEGVL